LLVALYLQACSPFPMHTRLLIKAFTPKPKLNPCSYLILLSTFLDKYTVSTCNVK